MDGKPLGKDPLRLEAGAHRLTCQIVQAPARIGLDRLSLTEFSVEREEAARKAADRKAATAARAAKVEAATLKLDIAQMVVTEKQGVIGDYPPRVAATTGSSCRRPGSR